MEHLNNLSQNYNSLKHPYRTDISNPNTWINNKSMSVNATLHHTIIAQDIRKHSGSNKIINSTVFPSGDHVRVSTTHDFSLEIQDAAHRTTRKSMYLILPADVRAFSPKPILSNPSDGSPKIMFSNNHSPRFTLPLSKENRSPVNNRPKKQDSNDYNIIMHSTFDNISQKLKQIRSKKK